MNLLDALIAGKLGRSGGATPAAVAEAISQFNASQADNARQDLGAEPEKLIVTVTEEYNSQTQEYDYSADKTLAEIRAALTAGKSVLAVYSDKYYHLLYDSDTAVYFGRDIESSNTLNHGEIFVSQVGNIDVWAYTEKRFQPIPTEIEISTATTIIAPANNNVYKCGELTSLTISNPPATGAYTIIFYSGATPTTTVGIENFVAEANKRYKIEVEDGYATYDSWNYTPTP